MAERHFQAAANAVAQGFQTGVTMRERQRDNARADRRLEMDQNADTRAQQRHSSAMAKDELDQAVRAKKRTALAAEIDLDLEMKRDEMKRISEAEGAFEKFQAGSSLIDWGDPKAPAQYEVLTRQYLPGILKHPRTSQKWEALDGVAKRSQVFTANKVMEAGLMRALTEAAEIAPDVLMAPPMRQDGKPDFEAIRGKVRERQEEIDRNAIELRRAGRATGTGMTQSQKMEIELLSDELKGINKAILDANATGMGNPDALLQMQNRKSSLMRQLRRFDDMPAEQPQQSRPQQRESGGAQQGEPATGQRQYRQGRFKVTVEE